MPLGKYTSSSFNHFNTVGEDFIKGLPVAGVVHIMARPQASQHVDRVSFRYRFGVAPPQRISLPRKERGGSVIPFVASGDAAGMLICLPARPTTRADRLP